MVGAKKLLTLDWKLCYGASSPLSLEMGRRYLLGVFGQKWFPVPDRIYSLFPPLIKYLTKCAEMK